MLRQNKFFDIFWNARTGVDSEPGSRSSLVCQARRRAPAIAVQLNKDMGST
jgi:hypothetical protein